jgi:hypothetical protein
MSRQAVGYLHSQVSQVLRFLSYGYTVPVVETHYRLDDVDQGNVARTPAQQYQLDITGTEC